MTTCQRCKRVVKRLMWCLLCGALLAHEGIHVPHEMYRPAPVKIVDASTLTSSATSTASGPPTTLGSGGS